MTPVVTGSALVQQQGEQGYRTGITGTTADYADVTDLELVVGTLLRRAAGAHQGQGRDPRDASRSPSCSAATRASAIGQRVRIGRTSFRVIGVAKPTQ